VNYFSLYLGQYWSYQADVWTEDGGNEDLQNEIKNNGIGQAVR